MPTTSASSEADEHAAERRARDVADAAEHRGDEGLEAGVTPMSGSMRVAGSR